MAVDWSYYDKYEWLINKYMLPQGEGETIVVNLKSLQHLDNKENTGLMVIKV